MTEQKYPQADVCPGLRPPQFGTRALLLLVATIAVVLAVTVRLSPLAACVVLLTVGAVLAHVAGNVIGTQLRANGTTRPESRPVGPDVSQAARYASGPATLDCSGAPSELRQRRPLGRSIWIPIVAWAAAAAVLGGALLALVNWQHATVANVAFGAISFAVLGGLLGFATSSLLQVARNAWSQAQRAE